MPIGSPNLARRERSIEAARRRLRKLEIETHRIKADLARLEAEYEDDVADVLSRRLRRRERKEPDPLANDAVEPAPATTIFASTVSDAAQPPSFVPTPAAGRVAGRPSPGTGPAKVRPSARVRPQTPPEIRAEQARPMLPAGKRELALLGWRNRKTAGPLACSIAVHAVALFFCLSFSIVTLVQQQVPLFARPVVAEDNIPRPLDEVKIEPTKFADAELQNTLAVNEEFNIADNVSAELEPAELGAGNQARHDIGQLDSLPSDLATLMSGAGKPASGKPGGEVGNAAFFGARAKGTRFAFVIDNSSSMKGGRLDAARAELIRTIESLTPKQSFYVIFISDQTYPMFFPRPELDMLPATAPNIKRLVDWLPNAILASGKNRELIKAMDMAAALRPDVVYLLWDGDMKYSDTVRRDVMTHLTAPNQWNFTMHTIGFNVTSLDNAQNLTTIAQAHGGVFRRIDLPNPPPK